LKDIVYPKNKGYKNPFKDNYIINNIITMYKIKIYKIVNDTDNNIYIGSTRNELRKRLSNHKTGYKKYINCGSGYVSSYILFENYGVENCKIILLEEFDVLNKEQQLKHERYYFDMLKNNIVNIKKPYATKVEELQTAKINNKIYRDTNFEYLKAQKQNRKINNPEELKLINKQWRNKNKSTIAKQRATKIMCECGLLCASSNMTPHKKTNRHITLCAEINTL
jgi:hypothetical protein